jgi:hypothetical protein
MDIGLPLLEVTDPKPTGAFATGSLTLDLIDLPCMPSLALDRIRKSGAGVSRQHRGNVSRMVTLLGIVSKLDNRLETID